MSSLFENLMTLDSIHGVSGNEGLVAAYMKEKLLPITDDYYSDSLGNQVFIKKGTHPHLKLMLAAHMDEIGFIVHHIDEKGFVYIVPVGIHDNRMAINQVLAIQTEKGIVKGITGAKPAHTLSPEEIQKAIPIDQIHIDVGTFSREETEKLGIKVGDYVAFDRLGQCLNGKVFTGKAVDNRAGCAVLIEVMSLLSKKFIEPTVYAVTTVQEEIGIRGAGPVAYSIQPDIALVIDVTLAGGTPGIEDKQLPIKLGEGPAIKFFDWSLNTFNGIAVPKELTKKFEEIAERENIPYQREVLLHAATDAAKISLSARGILTGGISIPSRYIHSATGCVHMNDLKNTVHLIIKCVENSRNLIGCV